MEFTRAYSISRSLSNAWRLILVAPTALLVGGALLILLDGHHVFGVGWEGTGNRGLDELFAPLVAFFVGFSCLLGLFFYVATSWLLVGYTRAVEELARTGEDRIAAIFEAKDRWFPMTLARLGRMLVLLVLCVPFLLAVGFGALLHEGLDLDEGFAVLATVVGVLFYVPVWLYVALGLALVIPAVALEGLDPLAAAGRSWSLVRGNRLWLLLYSIALILVELSGFLLCCVGVFFTTPLARVAWTDSYLALTRGDEYLDGFLARPPSSPPRPAETPPPPAPEGAADGPQPSA